MIHLLHSADWQIGRRFGQFEADDAARLAEQRIETVAAIARLAAERRVDAVLVAGDVFDAQTVADKTILRLFDALRGYDGPWLLLAGNHDAALAESVWTRAHRLGCLGGRVHAPARPGVVALGVPGLAVLAAPLVQRHTWDDASAVFDHIDTPAGHVRVGVAHGSVADRLPEAADAANPIAADRAARARLDYLALGDWHGCLRIDARTWYAGTPEPERFRGNDPGHVLDVRIHAPGAEPAVESVPVGRHRWRQARERVLVDADAEAIEARMAIFDADDVVHLILEGRIGLAARERLLQAVSRASARVRALALDADGLALEPEAHELAALGADGYVGEVLAELRDRQAGDTREAAVAREALRLLVTLQRDDDDDGSRGGAP